MMYTWQYAQARHWGLTESLATARSAACWKSCGSTKSRHELSLRRGLPARGRQRQPAAARPAGRGRQAMERPLRVPQDHPLAQRRVLRVRREALRRQAAGLPRQRGHVLGRRGRLVGPGNGLAATPTRRWPAARSSWPWPTASAAATPYPAGRNQRGLAQLHPLRRAHLGRLLLDQPAGQRLHQGPVEDQGPVRRRRGQASHSALGPGQQGPGRRWCGPTGPALVVFNPTSWPRTDVLRVKLPEGHGRRPSRASLALRRRTARCCWSRTCRPAATAC